jgi:uncharacterized cupin superfamily protein
MTTAFPIALCAADAPERPRSSNLPALLAAALAGRSKRPLGDRFGLRNFGVNLTRLAPGAQSAYRHAHQRQDEFVYILEGEATLVTDAGRTPLSPGMCAGFRAGTGDAHHIVNEGTADVVLLEVGDRTAPDEASYPEVDLRARFSAEGTWTFTRRDGSAFGADPE